MHLFIPDTARTRNIPADLRRAGYHPEVKHRSGERSYVRSIAGGDFPRFHIYIEEAKDGWQVGLHLDQKAPSYSGTAAHGGEYDGEVVAAEVGRLQTFLK